MQGAALQNVPQRPVDCLVLVQHGQTLEGGGHHPSFEVVAGAGEVPHLDFGARQGSRDAPLNVLRVEHQLAPGPFNRSVGLCSMAGSTPICRSTTSQRVSASAWSTRSALASVKSHVPWANSRSSCWGPQPAYPRKKRRTPASAPRSCSSASTVSER